MTDDDESKRSRIGRLIGDAQEHAHACQETALAVHAGTSRVPARVAERELHVAVMSLWALLQRFQSETQMSEKWRADGALDSGGGVDPDEWTVEIDGERHTLADLGDWRLKTTARPVAGGGPVAGSRQETEVIAETLPMDAAIDVLDLLDRVAHELDFSATVESPTPRTEADHEDLRGLVELRGQDASDLPGGDA
jgi:hypothetical protein